MTRGTIDLKIVNDRLEIVRSALAELRRLPHTSLDYDAVTPEELFAVIQQHLGDIDRLADQLEAATARLAAAPGDPPPAAPATAKPLR